MRLPFAVSEEHTENRPRLDNDSRGLDHTVDVDTAVQDHRCRAGTFQNPAGAEDIEDWDHKRIFRSNPLKKRNRFLQGIKFHADKNNIGSIRIFLHGARFHRTDLPLSETAAFQDQAIPADFFQVSVPCDQSDVMTVFRQKTAQASARAAGADNYIFHTDKPPLKSNLHIISYIITSNPKNHNRKLYADPAKMHN